LTPLCTQLTYEGLIDEVFSIVDATIDLPAEMVIDPKSQEGKEPVPVGKKIKTPLNSNDQLFRDVRDLNFSMVGPQLNIKAKQIDEYYKERYAAKTITEIKEFMTKLPRFQKEHQYLRIQSNIAEAVLSYTRDAVFRDRLECEQNLLALADPEGAMNYIEESINKQEPFTKVFRLLCLYSLTNNGIREKMFNVIRKDLLQTYGYESLYFMENLMKLGMFKLNTSRVNTYSRVKQDLNLIIEEMNEKDPNDVAYVYSGYAPISIRLVQQALNAPSPSTVLSENTKPEDFMNISSSGSGRSFPLLSALTQSPVQQLEQKYSVSAPGWGESRIDSIVRDLPGGPAFHARQFLPKGLAKDNTREKLVLVYFVGGCTFTEISSLRFLAQKMEGHDFLVATTKLINGNSFLDALKEKLVDETMNPNMDSTDDHPIEKRVPVSRTKQTPPPPVKESKNPFHY